MELFQLLICGAAVFLGGILQGCMGFGFAFISLPVLAVFLPPTLATPLIVSLSLIVNLIVIFTCREHANKRIIAYLLAGGAAGTPIGSMILQHVDASAYSLLAGILIMAASALFLFDKRWPVRDTLRNYFPAGFISGIFNASLGLSGPPVVLFMSKQAVGKDAMRATMIGYFLMINIVGLLWFVHAHLISMATIHYMGYFIPAVVFGTLIGTAVSRFVEEKLFRRIILVLVMVIGFTVSIQSLI